MSGFLPERTIHVHVSRYCNLRCLHCYSASGPGEARAALRSDVLLKALELLRDEPRHQRRSIGPIDAAGVFRHRSFDWAMRGLECLRLQGRRSAVALCISKASFPETPEVAYLAIEKGASLLHVRPLVLAGRAQSKTIEPLAESDLNRLLLIVFALRQELGPRLNVQLDLVHSTDAWAHRTQYDALLNSSKRKQALLSDLVNPLVITDTGGMKPLTYEFPDAFDLCHISELSRQVIASIKQEKTSPVGSVIDAALTRARNDERLTDWFEYCTDEALAWMKAQDSVHIQKETPSANSAGGRRHSGHLAADVTFGAD